MRKILRLGDMAGGGRRLEQLHDLLGLRAIVQPRADLPEAQAHLAAVEVSTALLLPAAAADETGSASCPVTCSTARLQVMHGAHCTANVLTHPNSGSLSLQACYIVNDAVRDLWPEVEGRSKDYILTPKANQYQSLHITVEVGAQCETLYIVRLYKKLETCLTWQLMDVGASRAVGHGDDQQQ